MKILGWMLSLYFFVIGPIFAVDIYGHRGAAGLAPENTLEAYRTALDLGVDVLDLDVGLSKDNIVVVYHDMRLNPHITRAPNGHWLENPVPLINLTYQELLQYDVGRINPKSDYNLRFPLQQAYENIRIPTLQEVIQYAKSRSPSIRFQIEIKTSPFDIDSPQPEIIVPLIANIITQEKAQDQTEIHSFDWRNLKLLANIAPQIRRSYITYKDTHVDENAAAWTGGPLLTKALNSFPKLVHSQNAQIWCPSYEEVSEEDIREAHALGLKVTVWSVDEPEDMNRMIDLGVDGIITNRPDLLRGLLAARSLLHQTVTPHQT